MLDSWGISGGRWCQEPQLVPGKKPSQAQRLELTFNQHKTVRVTGRVSLRSRGGATAAAAAAATIQYVLSPTLNIPEGQQHTRLTCLQTAARPSSR